MPKTEGKYTIEERYTFGRNVYSVIDQNGLPYANCEHRRNAEKILNELNTGTPHD